jgi:hypothetical protein
MQDVDFSVSILSRSKVINNLLINQISKKSSIFFLNLRFLFFCFIAREPDTIGDRIAIYKTNAQGYGKANATLQKMVRHYPGIGPARLDHHHGFHIITRRTPA